jgi:hypothetical protein
VKFLKEFWQYWKWLCVALMTSFVILFVLSMIITHFQMPEPDKNIRECIESGGTWDADSLICKAAG